MELARAGAGARSLHVGHDLGRRGEALGDGIAGGRQGDDDIALGVGEEGVDVRGLRRDGGESALLGRSTRFGVLGRRDGFGDWLGHGSRLAVYRYSLELGTIEKAED